MITNFEIFENQKSFEELGIYLEGGDYLTVEFIWNDGFTRKVGIMYVERVFRVSFDWHWVGQMGKMWQEPHTMRSRIDRPVCFNKVLYHGKSLKDAIEANDKSIVMRTKQFDL